jgi:rsbT co-antagonist protein RsbR
VGALDTDRAGDLIRSLLAGITRYRAKIVILDVTGVPMVDTEVASYLDRMVQSARLKGAQTIITGMTDQVVEAVVGLGIDWGHIIALPDLQAGLIAALHEVGLDLTASAAASQRTLTRL